MPRITSHQDSLPYPTTRRALDDTAVRQGIRSTHLAYQPVSLQPASISWSTGVHSVQPARSERLLEPTTTQPSARFNPALGPVRTPIGTNHLATITPVQPALRPRQGRLLEPTTTQPSARFNQPSAPSGRLLEPTTTQPSARFNQPSAPSGTPIGTNHHAALSPVQPALGPVRTPIGTNHHAALSPVQPAPQPRQDATWSTDYETDYRRHTRPLRLPRAGGDNF